MSTDISFIIKKALEDLNYFNCRLDFNLKKETIDGFLSDVSFVNVNCETKNGDEIFLPLVIKSSKIDSPVRDSFDLENIFKQEVLLYETVFPAFREFQNKNKVKNIFNPLPKLYKTVITEKNELMLLENLNADGFDMYDKRKAFNLDHLNLTLTYLGKLHALSFALRAQEPQIFQQTIEKMEDVFQPHFRKTTIYQMLPTLLDQVFDLLLRHSENELYDKLRKLLDKGHLVDQLLELSKRQTTCKVINHCDCWNNNLLFKYKDETKIVPSKLAIIDWQLVSVLNSPIYDLSIMIYTCGSPDDLKNLKKHLDVYYDSLSSFMRELGSNPDILFPYELFLDHWRIFSLIGFMIAPMIMKLSYCRHDEVKMDGASNPDEYSQWILDKKIDDKEHAERILAISRTFLSANV